MKDLSPGRWVATVPAKLNLGLAILGRRADGFHDLCSVMQTVTICDRLSLGGAGESGEAFRLRVQPVAAGVDGLAVDDPGLASDSNLAVRAVRAALNRLDGWGTFDLSLTKGIPAASGMGGASADAAAGLLLAERATGGDLGTDARRRLAADLGSDVPFFLTGGTALVTGRGERVEPLPPIAETTFVVVFPHLATPIPRKTARLFAELIPADLGYEDVVLEQVSRVHAAQPIDAGLLGNAFGRPLAELAPELMELRTTIASLTGRAVALTGAGPSHYVVEPDPERAVAVAGALKVRLGTRALVFVCQPWDGPPAIRLAEDGEPGPGVTI